MIHASGFLLYMNKNMDGNGISDQRMSHIIQSEAKHGIVDELIDIRGNTSEIIKSHMQWLGLPDINDWTWQDIGELYEDVPDEVDSFLKTSSMKKLFKLGRGALGLNTQ